MPWVRHPRGRDMARGKRVDNADIDVRRGVGRADRDVGADAFLSRQAPFNLRSRSGSVEERRKEGFDTVVPGSER